VFQPAVPPWSTRSLVLALTALELVHISKAAATVFPLHVSKRASAGMPETSKVVPLTCHGHSRPVPHVHFSAIGDDDGYYIISACKDGNPMLRDGVTGDWIGTFLGHKGAVWQARLSSDASLAATASADFSAYVRLNWSLESHSQFSGKFGIPSPEKPCTRSRTAT
jgi:WD40 repeat protein